MIRFICIIGLLFSIKSYGQIIYHDLNPDLVFPAYVFPPASYSDSIDIDSDGINDFRFRQYHDPASPAGFIDYSIVPLSSNKIIVNSSSADTLKYGDSIKVNSNYAATSSANIFYQYSTTNMGGNWHNLKNHFIGVSFNSTSGLKYGWIRLRDERTIVDCAYNSVSNQPLKAGEGLPMSASFVKLSDIANFANGLDLNIKFDKALFESTILGYRVLVVPSAHIATFNIDSAKQTLNANSIFVSSQNINIDMTLNASSVDVYGNPITSLIGYNAYVLSYPNLVTNFDTLMSAISNKVILQNPNLPAHINSITSTKIPAGAYNLNLQFNTPSSEIDIYNYRLFFITEKDSVSFTIDSANLVLPANYTSINKTGANQNLNFQSNLVRTNKGKILKPFEKYRAVLMSVTDTVNTNTSSLSNSSNSFTVYTQVQSVNEIIMSDVADNHNISDIKTFFKKVPNETNISGYRGLIVPETSFAAFNLDSANASTNFVNYSANGQNQSAILPIGLKDIHGNTVAESQVYHFFVLTLNDNNLSDVNALSSVNKYFLYNTPNYLYAGCQDTAFAKYYNIKDTTIEGKKFFQPSDYYMDLDNNGLNDLHFEVSYYGSPNGYNYYLNIDPLNQSEISFSSPTSTIVLAHDSADMVCHGLNWRSVQGTLKYSSYVFSPSYFNDYGDWKFDSINYIAVRLINTDTVYAWIRAKVSFGSNSVGLTIYSYGLQKAKTVGIEEKQLNEIEVNLYPNPAIDYATIIFHDKSAESKTIELIGIEGKVIFTKTVTENEYNLNTSSLSSGIYGLRIITQDGKSKVFKLVVQ